MRRCQLFFFQLFVCCFCAAWATEEQPPELNFGPNIPNLLIAGCIDPITGAYSSCVVDYAIPGPYSLKIVRSLYSQYSPKEGNFKFLTPRRIFYKSAQKITGFSGIDNPGFSSGYQMPVKAFVVGKNGNCHTFVPASFDPHYGMLRPDLIKWSIEPLKGITNASLGVLSARTNLKNTQIDGYIEKSLNGTEITYKKYASTGNNSAWIPELEKRMPSGHTIHYSYEKLTKKASAEKVEPVLKRVKEWILPSGTSVINGEYLSRIVLKSPSGKELSAIDLEYPEYASNTSFDSSIRDIIARTSDGRAFTFHMEGGPDGVLSKEKAYDYISKLTHISGTDQVPETYKYEGRFGWFSEIARPEGRFLKLVQAKEDHEKIYQLIAPANPGDNAAYPIVTINYHIQSKSSEEGKSGFTESYDANNNRTDYYYTESRVNEVRCFKKDGVKDTSDLLYWGSGKNDTNLITTAISNSQGQVILAKHYTYDVSGNVIKERLYGNLTGQNAFVTLNKEGVPDSSNIEFCETQSIYTADHLCSERIEPNGKKTTYTYKPGTNLVTSQIVHLKNGKKRFFYEYDIDHVLVSIIEDNGLAEGSAADLSNVTFRKCVQIKPRQKQPALGMPEEKSVYFWDPKTNKNSLAKREVFFYNSRHKLIQKDVYDATNKHQITLNWTYDEKGRCISEINALGQKTDYAYDANNNLIKQVQPGNLTKEFSYDKMNRLTLEKVADPVTREIQELRYTYDAQGNCMSQTSYVNDKQTGHTIWKYDHKNRIILQGKSGLIDHEGQDLWCYEHYEYDALGNKTLTAAPNNSCPERSTESPITQASYTIRNSPMHIIYPDNSQETFTYYLDGNLHTHTKTDGTKLSYSYDLLGNVIHTKEVSATGKALSNSYATYDALGRLVTKKDACGHTKCFTYDTFGRLSTESTKSYDGYIAYSYDELGREIAKAYYEKGKLSYKEEVAYDLLDRPICRELKDSDGAVQEKEEVVYDAFGNIKEKRNYGAQGVAKSLFTYDGFGRLCESINPMGDKVKITYSLVNLNRWNFWTLCKETVDSLGRKTKELYNTHGRVREVLTYDKKGALIEHTSKIYDSRDNLTYEQQKDPVSGKVLFEVAFSYNLADQIILQVEGYGHPGAKKTQYEYNAYSQLIKQINPEVALFYEYIKDGQVSRLYTEDGTLDYYYHYDPLGQLVLAEDPEGVCLSREYDALGNLTKDAYSDIELVYSYSPLGRREKVHLPDGSKISYKYQGAYLVASEYKGETTKITQRDLSGRILSLELPFSQGKIHKELDLCGRISSLKAPYFSEDLFYDEAGRLIKKSSKTPFGPEEVAYSYDDLDQLISEGNQTYKYDSSHNRIEDSQKLFVHTALNQLQSVKGQEKSLKLKYDLNGNVTQKLGDKDFYYVYDALDRLIEINAPGYFRYTFKYDALSRRVSETYNGEKRTFIYEEMDELGAIASKEIIELRIPIEGIEAEIANSHHFIVAKESYVPIYDHRGNVALLLSSYYKTPSMAYRYRGFGEVEVLDVEKAESLIGYFYTERKNACPWLFSSKRCIKETGLTAFGFRDYDPSLGKWMSPDPAGFVDGLNLYAYVRNNPLTNYDAYGLWSGVGDTGFDDFSREVIGSVSSDPNIQDALSRMPSYQDMHEENKRVIRSTEQFTVGAVDGIVTRVAETGLDLVNLTANALAHPIDTAGATITGVQEMFATGWNTLSHPIDALNSMKQTASTLNARELGNVAGGLAFDAYAMYSGAKLGFYIAKAGCRSAARIGGSMSRVSVIRASRMAMGTKRIQSAAQSSIGAAENFFANKTFGQLKTILERKFGPPRPGAEGGASYYNHATKRTFHIHHHHSHNGGKPHVDIRRRGKFKERKYDLKE